MIVGSDRDRDIEVQITAWRAYVQRHRELHHTDVDELEDHLRSRITELTEAGLDPDEAFLIAVKRMGSLDEVSREFAREHSDRLWKQLVLTGARDEPDRDRTRRDLLVMISFTAIAALAIKVPVLFGLNFGEDDEFYGRNIGLFALAPLAAYFAWQRRVSLRVVGVLALLFLLGAVGANAYPTAATSQSLALTMIHLPLALWVVVGVAYMASDWRSDGRRMDFIRFTGEWLIYFVLLGLGGGVLTAFVVGIFNAIGVDVEQFVSSWLLPCGAMGAVVVSAWLVEAKQSVIENMAPVLTRVFTPLFTAALVAFLIALVATGSFINVDRNVLILFDLLLAMVLGLLLYTLSARDPAAPPRVFDRMQLGLVVSALIIDVIVLVAITSRITEWGFSPNKTAALGENLILLVNLAWSAWLLFGFVRSRAPFARLERWQTRYVAVYALWVWVVVLVFPPVFSFV